VLIDYVYNLQWRIFAIRNFTTPTFRLVNRCYFGQLGSSSVRYGGWVEALNNQMITLENGSLTMKGIELNKPRIMRRKTHHMYVTDRRDVRAVCNEVVESLVEFLDQRFAMDEETVRIAKPFAALAALTVFELKDVHKLLGCESCDLDATDLSLEYDELLAVENIDGLRKMSLPELVRFLASSDSYINVTTILARILAAKPHSADVERLISTSTTLKTIKRSSLSVS
jgi:hypothetical protein